MMKPDIGEPISIVLARFERLPASAQIVAGVAAISPVKIERGLVKRLIDDDLAPVDHCLRAGLLIADGSALRFRNEYARRAVEESLTHAAARELSRRLLAALVSASDDTQSDSFGLTAREREVTALLCEGLRNAQIAGRLCRSVRTIDHHVQAILVKMGVATRTEAVAAAIRAGFGRASRSSDMTSVGACG